MLSPFECLCGNFILPKPASYVFFYAIFNLRKLLYIIKYRRKEIYGQLKKDIGEILRTLCKQKNVEILEAEACVDHIYMPVSIPPYPSVAQFMGFLKGKSSLMIIDKEQLNDFRQACEFEVQVWGEKFLV